MNIQSIKLDLSSVLALGFFLAYLVGGIYLSFNQGGHEAPATAYNQEFTCEGNETGLSQSDACQEITGL